MILQVDKQGESVIQQLCHIALMQGGINNLKQVNLTLTTLQIISEPGEVPPEKLEGPESEEVSKEESQPEEAEPVEES